MVGTINNVGGSKYEEIIGHLWYNRKLKPYSNVGYISRGSIS